MGSITDFLWGGDKPLAATQYGTTTENIPKWLSDYSQGILAKANAVAAEGYQPYGGPRIAGMTPEQEAAKGLTKANIGSWQPYGEQAGALIDRSTSLSPLDAASPFLESAAQRTPEAIDQYMNPYIQNVLDRNAQMSQRTLEEKFLPSLQGSFAGAGQFGSTRMMESGERGVRDITADLNQQNQAALAGAYQQAGTSFQTDAAREAGLAATTGELARQSGAMDLEAADRLRVLGESGQRSGAMDAAALAAIGRDDQEMGQKSMDLAYQDFLAQRDFPKEQLDWMNQLAKGLPQQSTSTTTAQDAYAPRGPSGLEQIAGLYSTYQGMNQ